MGCCGLTPFLRETLTACFLLVTMWPFFRPTAIPDMTTTEKGGEREREEEEDEVQQQYNSLR